MKIRKSRSVSLSAATIAVFGGAAIMASSAQADTPQPLPPIEVNGPDCGLGSYAVFDGDRFVGCTTPGFGVGGSGGGASSIPTGSAGGSANSAPTPAQQEYLKKCATAYGSYQKKQGANPAYTTKFSDQYGWHAENAAGSEVDWRSTQMQAQPGDSPQCQGKSWKQDDGTTFTVTSSCGGTTWAGKTTIIWVSAYSNDARMVNVLAHEFAHQWGADEPNAGYVGDAAQQAFEQDHGQKCQ